MDIRQAQKFGEEPTPETMVQSLKELSLEELQEVPFFVLNELLKTKFPAGSNGEAHKLLYSAIQKTVISNEMQAPLELVLKDDGMWVRVCGNEESELYPEAQKLAQKFNLGERITTGLCPECTTKQLAVVEDYARRSREEVDLSIFKWDGD